MREEWRSGISCPQSGPFHPPPLNDRATKRGDAKRGGKERDEAVANERVEQRGTAKESYSIMTLVLSSLPFLAASTAQVTGLQRYAVKGLSADSLESVVISSAGETFPDDRRFALLEKANTWDGKEWLHKENFLCSFTDPELLAKLESSYSIHCSQNDISRGLPADLVRSDSGAVTSRLLEIRDRASRKALLGPINLGQEHGRQELCSS
jgi:hypothetical protein